MPFSEKGRLAQLVRALLSHGRGHEFKSRTAHQSSIIRPGRIFFTAERRLRSGDEHTRATDQPKAGRCPRCNQREASHQPPVGALHAPKRFAAVSPSRRGAPRKNKGARGERKTRERLSFPRTAHAKKGSRSALKNRKGKFADQYGEQSLVFSGEGMNTFAGNCIFVQCRLQCREYYECYECYRLREIRSISEFIVFSEFIVSIF